jgi:hypothetical protein
VRKVEKKLLEEESIRLNSRIGEVMPFIVFEDFIRKGMDYLCPVVIAMGVVVCECVALKKKL